MNIANGWKTYTVGIAAILLGALGAVPSDWSSGTVAEVLGVLMVILRSITVAPAGISLNRTFVVPLVLVGVIGTGFTGCSGAKPPTMAQCGVLAAAAQDQILVGKCAKAPDPVKDGSCIAISALNTAYAICLSQVPPPLAPTPAP